MSGRGRGILHARFIAPGLLAGLVALALALPAVAPAAPLSLTVTIKGTGAGTVECEAEEGPEECKSAYPAGTELILYAEEGEGSEFVKWTGAGGACTTEPVCEMKMSTAKSVTATFDLILYPLSVTKNGSGTGTVECEAEAGPEECKAAYPAGSELTLLAKPKPGSEFVEWGGECGPSSEAECALTMEEGYSVTATFDLEPALTVTKNGAGTGTVRCEAQEGLETCKHSYPKGTELALIAEPEPGSSFAGFSAGTGSAASCATAPCLFTIEANSSLTATFSPTAKSKFKLTVSKSGAGVGTVKGGSPAEPNTIDCGTGAGCEHEYEEGAVVTLTHEASAGSEFKEWTGACTGSGTCKVTMSEARTVGAVFDVKASSGGGGGGGGSSGGGSSGSGGSVARIAPGIASAAGSATVSGGRLSLRLACAGGPCVGTLELSARIGRGSKTIGGAAFSLAAGASTTLRIALSPAAKRALEAGGTLRAKAVGTGVASSTVRLKLAGGARKRH